MISVVIPTYNGSNTISRPIRSVLNQTFKDFELIVVDDASTDNTEEVVKKFDDKRLRYIKHEDNSGGPAKPKNTGINHSQGEYIAFLDHDDEWLPKKLEEQLEVFNNPSEDVGVVSCNVLSVYEEDKTVEYKIKRELSGKEPTVRILESCFIHSSSSVMVKKEALDKLGGFDENLNISGDWELWIRILQKYKFDFVNDFLLRYYFHGSNLSLKSSEKKPKDVEYILSKHKDLYKDHPKEYSEMLRYTGNLYILSGDKIKGREFLRRSLKINKRIKTYFNVLLSYSGIYLYRKTIYLKRKLKFYTKLCLTI